MLTSQVVLWLSIALAAFFVLFFLFGKRGFVAPSRLRLKSHAKSLSSYGARSKESFDSVPSGSARDLNVHFIYNGHSFEAFEVLGLPAGASMDQVQAAFAIAKKKGGPEFDFLEAAFLAIKSRV